MKGIPVNIQDLVDRLHSAQILSGGVVLQDTPVFVSADGSLLSDLLSIQVDETGGVVLLGIETEEEGGTEGEN
jgi:hypothetical protein